MFYADLHIHSLYSRATSKQANLQEYYNWARIKGIQVISTSDFTHPDWLKTIREELTEDGSGLLTLKAAPKQEVATEEIPVRFCLSTEISLIYKEKGKTRKVHNVVFMPTVEHAAAFSRKLAAVGNIKSDGRPILGITSKELLCMVKDVSPEAHLIPAHIWTPWFSLFGSNSGYDHIEECFEDMTPYIFALETGLSSDPAMAWMVSDLDRYTLVSHSDAHSPSKLGREAVAFNTELTYQGIMDALQKKTDGYAGTVEFFPEEGKYHFDGHRKCGVVLNPAETDRLNDVCPVCKKKLTLGVMHRVVELADRRKPVRPAGHPGFKYFVPLPEILAQAFGVSSPNSKKVQARYLELVGRFGNEFNLVEKLSLDEIRSIDPFVARAVENIRADRVDATAGYDGEFGVIHALSQKDMDELAGQKAMFGIPERKKRTTEAARKKASGKKKESAAAVVLSEDQQRIVDAKERAVAVCAGPGSGKTRVLVQRVLRLIGDGWSPSAILILTFTNRAVDEIKARLAAATGTLPVVNTFHGFCLSILKSVYPERTRLVDEQERELLLRHLDPDIGDAGLKNLQQEITLGGQDGGSDLLAAYRAYLVKEGAFDIGLLLKDFIDADDGWNLEKIKDRYGFVFVDEFQDINLRQYRLLELFREKSSFFIIGDPDQSIYAWRGSRPDLFDKFIAERCAARYELAVNYRSQAAVVAAGQALIRCNPGHHLAPTAAHTEHTVPEYLRPETAEEEAYLVVKRIEERLGGSQMHHGSAGSAAPAEMAVLYRSSWAAEAVKKRLDETGIPVEMRGEHLAENPARRILVPLLTQFKGEDRTAYLQLLFELGSVSRREMLVAFGRDDWKAAAGAPEAVHTIDRLVREYTGAPLARAVGAVADAFRDMLEGAEGAVAFLTEAARDFGTDAGAFLDHLASNPWLITGSLRPEGVVLSTFHGSKGLEFHSVFIVHANEGVIPSLYSEDIEEERRLLFVAMTRSEKRLTISAPRQIRHRDPRITGAPSRFIGELAGYLKETVTKKARQLSLF